MLIGRITREFLPGARRVISVTAERRTTERIRVKRHSNETEGAEVGEEIDGFPRTKWWWAAWAG